MPISKYLSSWSMKRLLIRDLLPPVVTRWISRIVRSDWLSNDYGSWEAASAAAVGYTTNLEICGAQAARVRHGEEPPIDVFVALAGILLVGEKARVLDFGGGLGLAYLRLIRAVSERIEWWRIVDLPPVVAYGRDQLEDDRLLYFETIFDSTSGGTAKPNVLLCSSVLQYLPDTYATLKELLALKPQVVLLNEVPLHPKEVFYVQTWPKDHGMFSAARRQIVPDKLADVMRDYDMIGERDLHPPQPNGLTERFVARLYRRKS